MVNLTPSGGLDSAQIQNALDTAGASGGGQVFLSAGSFKLDSKIIVPAGIELIGSGRGSTFLQAQATLAGDVVDIESASRVAHVTLTTDGSYYRTSGAMVRLIGNAACLEYFQIQYFNVGVVVVGISISSLITASRVYNGLIRMPQVNSTATAIVCSNFSNMMLSDLVITGTSSGAQPGAGIHLRHGDTALLSNINCTRHGIALLIAPEAGESLYALQCSNCLWDSAGDLAITGPVNSAFIIPSGDGKVVNASFATNWFGLAAGHGLEIAAGGSAKVDCISLSGCEFMHNAGDGLRCNGPGVSNVVVNGGHGSGNVNGIQILNGATGSTISGFRAGPCTSRGPNSNYGIAVDPGAGGDFVIVGNNLVGNSVGSLMQGRTDGIVGNNLI